jgi:thiol-disulfide isomerase/thioredoxin
MKKLALLILVLLFSLSATALESDQFEVYFFYSKTCPHCLKEKPFLECLENDNPGLRVYYLEIGENHDLLKEFVVRHNTTTAGVPRTFVGDKVFIGFSDKQGPLEYNPVYKAYTGYQNQLEAAILRELQFVIDNETQYVKLCEPLNGKLPWGVFLVTIIYLLTYPLFRRYITANTARKRYWTAGLIAAVLMSFFIFITVTPEETIRIFAQQFPFPLFVFIVALADGFNPCAFTVLIILLSLMTYTRSKRTMGIIGSTFILTSAVMYFIFIMVMILIGSWVFEQYGQIIMLSLGVIILIAGIINLKDYLFFKKGVSLSLSEEQQSKITQRARRIVSELITAETRTAFLLALGGTIVLAVFVNLVELGCTAILPAVYMASLIQSFGKSIGAVHVLWTGVYAIVYIIPLFVILLNFIYTFRSSRVSEEQGRILKLFAGLFMVLFGILMILKPELLIFG